MLDAYNKMQGGESHATGEEFASTPDQHSINAEFARLASMGVSPNSVSCVVPVPKDVRDVMAKYRDVPIRKGWVKA